LTTLIAALKTHRTESITVRAVLKAFYRLAFNQSVRDKLGMRFSHCCKDCTHDFQYLGQEKIVTEVVEVMKLNPKDGLLQRQAIILLLQLVRQYHFLVVTAIIVNKSSL